RCREGGARLPRRPYNDGLRGLDGERHVPHGGVKAAPNEQRGRKGVRCPSGRLCAGVLRTAYCVPAVLPPACCVLRSCGTAYCPRRTTRQASQCPTPATSCGWPT